MSLDVSATVPLVYVCPGCEQPRYAIWASRGAGDRMCNPCSRRQLGRPAAKKAAKKRAATKQAAPSSPRPLPAVTICPAGKDFRFTADPAHRGEFGRLRPGEYPAPASTCAALAAERG